MSVVPSPARVLSAVLVVALLVTGCAGAGASGPEAATADGGVRLADVRPAADPRGLTGPSTAVVAETAVRPVVQDPRPVLPATVTDAQGTTVTVSDTSRILALDVYGTTSRIVYELGLGDSVVGRDTSSGFAEIAAKPLVTANGHELSAEAILELAPTVILTDTSLGPWDVVLQMRDAGIPVVVVDGERSVQTAGALVRQVADALGVSEAGAALAERTDAAIADTVAQIARVAPRDEADRLRVVFLYVRGQAGVYYLFGEGSGADSLIDAVGAVDVAGEIGWTGMKPVTDEGLVKAAPDVVLVMTHGLESVGGVDGLLERLPAVAGTPAGQHRRVVDMADDEVLSFGPRTADVLDALAVALYAPTARP
ncbi:ABC transporter substrate-binding protein [Cellulomonas sp.]|uniref:heme/hemin ABC transporter substrate-binding protein n=1 Tax=Cellulomonas sp. TaxID=40001 RepID=UPI00258B1536|nr:ABC transporter substrate-binding protein [Cellulomonas sp.]MCR6689261.1 ABC transporter substrate-binding protein [Cellulomonas sp.]